MDHIAEGFKLALKLLITFNPEIYRVIGLSIFVSGTATIIATLFSIPLGSFLGLRDFFGKALFSRLLFTAMSVPTVVIGLVVALFLARTGPLGHLGLLYTPRAMIIAQTLLVIPLCMGLTFNLAKNQGKTLELTGRTLGARGLRLNMLVVWELRKDIIINVVASFSRAISEVGAVMIVGGNILGQTRVITTSITMFNSMGQYANAIALGMVLLIISFVTNMVIYPYTGRK